MKITKRTLKRIIQEAINPAGVTAEFDNESVMLNGRPYDQEELASEVSNEEDWQDNFSIMGMYAAQALRDNYGVTTFTDYEQPGKSWSANEFIRHLRSIA